MKKLLIVMALFGIVGGGVATLWFFHVPPFRKAPKHSTTASTKSARPRVVVQHDAPAPVAQAPVATPPAEPAKPVVSPAPKPAPRLSDADLTRLAGVYEQMPVDDASKIMAKLPDSLVEPLLRRMDERQVGKLLATFAPERAARLTQAMARTAPQNDALAQN